MLNENYDWEDHWKVLITEIIERIGTNKFMHIAAPRLSPEEIDINIRASFIVLIDKFKQKVNSGSNE